MFEDFVRTLETDLRRETNDSYIFEEISQDYEAQMVQIFNKAVRDEIEASVGYRVMAESIQGTGVLIKKELSEHSVEEFEHFNQLIIYASNHGFLQKLDYNTRGTFMTPQELPTNLEGIVQFTQDLEKEAYTDYKAAAELANSVGDSETRLFFETLMQEELKHYDHISDHDENSKRSLNDF